MTGHTSRWWLAIATALTAALIAAGCGSDGGGGASSDKLAKEQLIRINTGGEPSTLDPAKLSDVDALNIVNQMFAGLYRIEGKDSELKPYLAEGMPEVSDDGLTYTVKMRDDAKWSNGDDVTAEDVVYGVQRSLDPKTEAYFSAFMQEIVGACEYNAGPDAKEKCGEDQTDGKPESVGVKAIDEHTVEFKLKSRVPWFDQLLSVNTFYPMPKDAIEKGGDKWTEPENIVTSGPFHLKTWKHSKQIVLEKSKTFWGADDITLKTVQLEMTGDTQTALRQFEDGKLDTGFTRRMVGTEDIDRIKSEPEYRSVQTTGTNYYYLNTKSPLLKDPKVRQGLAMAIDKQSVIENVTKRGDTPLNTVIPTTMPGWDTIKEGNQDFLSPDGKPDVDKAKELLAEGGWKDGDSLNLYYTTESSTAEAVAQSAQSDLAKVGVKLKLVPLPAAKDLYSIGTPPLKDEVHMVALGWGADYLDPQDYYQLFTCENVEAGLNTSQHCDEKFDKLYAEALETDDQDARLDLYKEMEGMLTGPDGNMPAIPLYQPNDDTVVQEWVKGFEITPSSLIFLDKVEIREH